MAAAAERLITDGNTSVCLWVFEQNAAAISFYERLGGITDAHGVDKLAGGEAPDRRMGWADVRALLKACRGGV